MGKQPPSQVAIHLLQQVAERSKTRTAEKQDREVVPVRERHVESFEIMGAHHIHSIQPNYFVAQEHECWWGMCPVAHYYACALHFSRER